MKAVTSISPNMIRLLGKKLYTSHHAVIAVRETLQNGVDAARKAGRHPEITIRFKTDGYGKDVFISCEDNGCGMSVDDIVKRLLQIGNGKTEIGATGGLGVAKIVLFVAEQWTVKTILDGEANVNFIDNLVWETEGDIISGNGLVKFDCVTGYKSEQYTDEDGDICTRNVPVHGQRAVELNRTIGTSVDVLAENFQYGIDTLALEMVRYIEKDVATVHVEFDTPNTKVKETITGVDLSEAKIIKETNDYTACYTKGNGRFVVRAHGLPQFVGYGVPGTLIVIDLKLGNLLPTDDGYPLSMSRESLQGSLGDEVRGWIDAMRVDYLSAQSILDKIEKVVQSPHIPGKSASESPSMQGVSMYMDGYDVNEHGDAKAAKDTMLSKAWGIVVREVAGSQSEFDYGIGLYGYTDHMAARETNDSGTFYLISPDLFRRATRHTSVDGKIVALWHLACHEVAHKNQGKHDEKFSAVETDVAIGSAERLPGLLKHKLLKTFLRSAY